MARYITRAGNRAVCFPTFGKLSDGKRTAFTQNLFGAGLQRGLLLIKICYSLISMVFASGSYFDMLSSRLQRCESVCTRGPEFPSRWLPGFSLQHVARSARPGWHQQPQCLISFPRQQAIPTSQEANSYHHRQCSASYEGEKLFSPK